MANTWKVVWVDEDKKRRLKRFDEIKEAVDYRNELREDGRNPHIVSAVHAYPVPTTDKRGRTHPKSRAPSVAHTWCPYCIEWRVFSVSAVRFEGIRSPEANRCPICTISDEDYYVKKMNHRLERVDDAKLYKGVVTMRNVGSKA